MTTLNSQQRAAVESTAKKILVVAGPGSGKTATLTARIVHLIQSGTPASRIVAITFTNAAADEIQRRVDASLGGAGPDGVPVQTVKLGFIGTIHSYAMNILRQHGSVINLPPRLSVMDEVQADEALMATAKLLHYKGTKTALEEAVKDRLEDLFRLSETTRPNNLSPAQLVAYEYFVQMLHDGCLSFDAIVGFAKPVLEACAGNMAVEELLVDEYQDCSNLTDWICKALPGRKFFVGDPDQAIYGFAGGNVQNIVGLANDKEWATFILEDNYRSVRPICEAATRLIERNMNRVRKVVRPVPRPPDKVWPVKFFHFSTPASEVAFIVAELRVALHTGKTCAVLARSNYVANATAIALEAAGIPLRKKERLVKPADWMLARRFVALAANPDNDTLAHRFLADTKGQKFADKVRLEAAEAGRTINGHLMKLPDNLDLSTLPQIFQSIGISADSAKLVEKARETLRPEDGAAELCIALGNPELHYKEVGDGRAVVVTTMHSAKGREWDWVFIVGADEQVIPGTTTEGPKVQEERRLMFVAATRPRERLVVTSAMTRTRGDWQKRPEAAQPSRFCYELGIV